MKCVSDSQFGAVGRGDWGRRRRRLRLRSRFARGRRGKKRGALLSSFTFSLPFFSFSNSPPPAPASSAPKMQARACMLRASAPARPLTASRPAAVPAPRRRVRRTQLFEQCARRKNVDDVKPNAVFRLAGSISTGAAGHRDGRLSLFSPHRMTLLHVFLHLKLQLTQTRASNLFRFQKKTLRLWLRPPARP